MADSADNQPYRVLARKYRPRDFTSLIGQEAMVQTLSNAIASHRLAHAFILTGVRGVGKTTTARIIAKALNCIGTDGSGEATANPCGVCENCVSISEDRNVDVMEMDAASRTGVEDIRELIDGVLYRPVSARFKVYIIDEVHMLSRNAFNALLKTLEEPPEHVKFIFATTEIRRVPVTVLSRCQRFDLRRIKFEVLVDHFSRIAETESAHISPGAIGLIARAADGSVRDGLSLLDQAIAHSGPDAQIGEESVRAMLGVAERVKVFDLFDRLMKGEISAALSSFDSMYHAGADPITILQDLAELTHWLTRLKAAPDSAEATPTSDLDLKRGLDVSASLPMSALARTWQILLKGLQEARTAYSATQAAEMVLVRIAYAADLPSPAEVIAKFDKENVAGLDVTAPKSEVVPTSVDTAQKSRNPSDAMSAPEREVEDPVPQTDGPTALAVQRLPQAEVIPFEDHPEIPMNFEGMVALFAAKGEPLLHAYLVNNVHLVTYEIGKISLRVSEEGPRDLAKHLSRCLNEWTGRAWFIEASNKQGEATLQQQREDVLAEQRKAAIAHPLVQRTLEAFPGADISNVRIVPDRNVSKGPRENLPLAPDDYLSYDYNDNGFDLDSFDPADTDEDYI